MLQFILFGCCIRCYLDVAVAFFVCSNRFFVVAAIFLFVALDVFLC